MNAFTTKMTKILGLTALIAVHASSCGGFKPTGAASSPEPITFRPFDPPAVMSYPLPAENLRMAYLQFILWKDAIPSKDTVARVMKLAKEVDDVTRERAPLLARRDKLAHEHASLLSDGERLHAGLATNTGAMRIPLKRIEIAEKSMLAKKLAYYEESVRSAPDSGRLTALRGEIEALEKTVAEQRAVLAPLEEQRAKLEAELAAISPKLDPVKAEMSDLDAQGERLFTTRATPAINELERLSEWPKAQPTSLTLEPGLHGLEAMELAGWDLRDDRGPQTYSTRSETGVPPTIVDARYDARGGRLGFALCIYNAELTAAIKAFRVDLSCVASEAGENDRPRCTQYSGDIARNEAAEGETAGCSELSKRRIEGTTRFGIAKVALKIN